VYRLVPCTQHIGSGLELNPAWFIALEKAKLTIALCYRTHTVAIHIGSVEQVV